MYDDRPNHREIEAIGEERGKTIGKALGEADALVVLLRTRGFAPTDDAE